MNENYWKTCILKRNQVEILEINSTSYIENTVERCDNILSEKNKKIFELDDKSLEIS